CNAETREDKQHNVMVDFALPRAAGFDQSVGARTTRTGTRSSPWSMLASLAAAVGIGELEVPRPGGGRAAPGGGGEAEVGGGRRTRRSRPGRRRRGELEVLALVDAGELGRCGELGRGGG